MSFDGQCHQGITCRGQRKREAICPSLLGEGSGVPQGKCGHSLGHFPPSPTGVFLPSPPSPHLPFLPCGESELHLVGVAVSKCSVQYSVSTSVFPRNCSQSMQGLTWGTRAHMAPQGPGVSRKRGSSLWDFSFSGQREVKFMVISICRTALVTK